MTQNFCDVCKDKAFLLYQSSLQQTSLILSQEDCRTIFNLLQHSYIPYENEAAHEVMARITRLALARTVTPITKEKEEKKDAEEHSDRPRT